MSTSDTVEIKLSNAERYVLTHLLTRFIAESVYEAVKFAHNSIELERAAERVKRFAQQRDLAWEGTLPRAELDAHRADLVGWLLEAEQAAEESQTGISKEDEAQERPQDEREGVIHSLEDSIVVDYAHKTVCERIIAQIDEAREPVEA
ncbi:MAG TPA: hypothetical protein VGN08_13570 [Solirubrobacteraceae bacterium]|jgi:hypothetical protein